MSATPKPQVSLRELKKQRAKTALEQAAFDLFARQGYDETTVDQIAATAEVSRASFFRYFSAKEDVLNSDDDRRRERFMAAFAARPDDAPVLTAVRDAAHTYTGGLDEEAQARSVTYFQVLVSSRMLLGRAYEIRIRWLQELEAELHRRLADRADAGTLVPMLAAVTLGVLETALRLAVTEPDSDIEAFINQGFALVSLPEGGAWAEPGHGG
ncbi:TetR/AcrR family transcriptional regulator [Streptomyces sp. NPDC088725]|uniref:TetR/AcrR family transcriptional regulator n=1 Tax=Streptomyces sp. NPDC088725 TaxID=3365873 RepID=UPI0037FA0513